MKFSTPLIAGTLIQRYKRFLADVTLDDGREITAHCANPGSMNGLKDAGLRIWLEPNDDPKRKLNYSWKLIQLPSGHMAGIDTALTNRIVKEALLARLIPELAAYKTIRPEVKYGKSSRIDFLLTQDGFPDTYVEVKNVTLMRNSGQAEFPDSVTARGAKHLNELADMVALGHRAVMLYLVQRTDCTTFQLASDIDPNYARAFETARSAGVEAICYGTSISPTQVTLANPIPFAKAKQN